MKNESVGVNKIFKDGKSPIKDGDIAFRGQAIMELYDFGGKAHQSLPKDEIVAQKKSYDNGMTEYWVKFNSVDNTLYNPADIREHNANIRYAKLSGLNSSNLNKVNKDCFNYYLNFLKSGDKMFLTKAQLIV